MNYEHPLETAAITTNMVAHYIYKAISELEAAEVKKFVNAEYVKGYLENTIDLLGTDDFYMCVLNSFYGINHQFGHDYYETEEELKDYVLTANLHLINDSLAVDDISNDFEACEKVIELLEEEREYEKQFDNDDE